MTTNVLTAAAALSDRDLLSRLGTLAGKEREATVELLAHLAALDARPSVYAAEGYASLFRYCTDALRLSEDAACARIEAARACGRFPAILDRLACGSLTLTSVRLLARHLTPENHERVLARAEGRSRHQIEALMAELAPQPDVPSSIRRLPAPASPVPPLPAASADVVASPPTAMPACKPRPIVQPTAPERYRVQFTIGPEAHEKLRRLQDLLRREIPDGDAGAIFERALGLLLAEVEKKKTGGPVTASDLDRIRARTDNRRNSARRSRYVPRAVARAVWRRDGGQCAFVSRSGRRCQERSFLELHHLEAHAKHGPPTVQNLSLRCKRHHELETELVFGPRALTIHGFDTTEPEAGAGGRSDDGARAGRSTSGPSTSGP